MRILAIAALLPLFVVCHAQSQDLQLGVTYTCSGERLYLESCNIRDLSDTSTCMVAHPDRPQHNGFMAYTTETRGALKKLLPSCKQPAADEVARVKAHYKKQNDIQAANEKKANDEADAIEAHAQAVVTGKKPQTADEKAINRCITAGRLPATCMGNSLLGAFGQMLSQVLPTANQEPPAGPAMAGVFLGAGNWRLDFTHDGVLVNCSFLSPDERHYTIDLKSNHAVLTIDTTPKPLVLTLKPDLTVYGPGPVTINGVVATQSSGGRYRNEAGTPISDVEAASSHEPVYDSSGQRVTGPIISSQTVFLPKTATCPALNLSATNAVGAQTMQTDLLKSMLGGDKGPPTPPGIRMRGIFAAPTGFSVQFYPESVILGCGPDVARAYPYTVVADGTQSFIKIAAPDHPLNLAFRPDGSLDPGTGPYEVHGRTITGQNDNDDFTFAPLNATCNLAVLTHAASIPTTVPTPTSPFTSGGAILSINSGLPAPPGTQNPLGGHSYILLRDDLATALNKGGLAVAPGVSPFKAIAAACANRTPDCQKVMPAVKADSASAARSDANGKATFPGVPPGTYYLMISGKVDNQNLFWGFKVDLKNGPNTITLDQRNATPIN